MSTDQATAVGRPAPPPLEWQAPLCPICGNETVHHGRAWTCDACRATWVVDPGGEDPGVWLNQLEPQCRSEGRSKNTGRTARCLLGENHVDADTRVARDHKGTSAAGLHLVWGRNTWVEETTPPAPKAERGARTAERIRAAKETRP
jgi:hypothetical protein